jgi:hypothetical protein
MSGDSAVIRILTVDEGDVQALRALKAGTARTPQ